VVWRKLLLIALPTIALLVAPHRVPTTDRDCAAANQAWGTCATASTDHVDVSASTAGTDGGGNREHRDHGDGTSGVVDVPPVSEFDIICMDRTQCRALPSLHTSAPPAPPKPGAPAAAAVSMAQVAAFYPVAPGTSGEPAGWAVAGLPKNLVSGAAVNTASGTLLGRPAQVRFTPVSWGWDYGDGSSATTRTGGDTWQHLGLHDFSTTATSHVYAARGTYSVHTTVTYTALYRVGAGGWSPVSGTLVLRAQDVTVDVRQPAPVLVQNGCDANPVGPGC
jgi:hypothetical protein